MMEPNVTDNGVTPKGALILALTEQGVSSQCGEDAWAVLQRACLAWLRKDHPDAQRVALVFDGNGGSVIPVAEKVT